ncbi:MAG: hypothetical protein VKK42_02480 [Lyngbya sp.]|nr:hypothetical protein [Lyngbya sp.]
MVSFPLDTSIFIGFYGLRLRGKHGTLKVFFITYKSLEQKLSNIGKVKQSTETQITSKD